MIFGDKWAILNLSYGNSVSDRQLTKDKIQDEQTCLSSIFQLLCKISNEGGFNQVVLGQDVCVKVWIHYFIGDTKVNNKWLGQYPGNQEGVQQPCRDCKCTFDSLKETNPYLYLHNITRCAQRQEEKTKQQGWWNTTFQVRVKI